MVTNKHSGIRNQSINGNGNYVIRSSLIWMLSGFILLAIYFVLSYFIYRIATDIAWHQKMLGDTPDQTGANLVLIVALLGFLRRLVELLTIILIPVGLFIGIRKIRKFRIR